MNSRVDEKGKQIKTRLLTAKMQWIKNERDCLVRLFEKHGYKIKNPGEHRPHMDNLHSWLLEKKQKEMILDSSKTKEAVNYCLNRWENAEWYCS